MPFSGFYISFTQNGRGTVSNSDFINGVGNEGSAISIGGRSEVEIKECAFTSNFGNKGAIYLGRGRTGNVLSNKFKGN